MASLIKEVGESTIALVKGFSVTMKNMLRKTVTENYPHQPVNFQPRYRGIHVLHRDESGLEKCVGCFLCAAACPSNCIYIEAAENTDATRISAGERYAKVYNIDYFAAFSAVTASRRAPRMPSPTVTDLNSPPTTSIRSCTARSRCWKARQGNRRRLISADQPRVTKIKSR